MENGELVIARILHGGMIDQQGLLHVGDIIKEVNGKEVGNDPKVLQEMLKEASGSVVLKILPSYQEPHTARQVSENRREVCITFLQLQEVLQPVVCSISSRKNTAALSCLAPLAHSLLSVTLCQDL